MTGSGENGRYFVDENGTARCAVSVVEYVEPHRAQEFDRRPCGAELYVEWSFTCPIGPGETVHSDTACDSAVSSGWQVTCTNGHVLHVSSNGLSATDYAESCAFDLLFQTVLTGGRNAGDAG